jgi:uncharacterized protein
MEFDTNSTDQSVFSVPLFALPNVVLFPRAILPLHIFEERYKAMTADALSGNCLIAMALLKRGWEKCYYERPAIEPVVCVGKILSSERLDDGRYNFLLQGLVRVRVLKECSARPYRVAKVEKLAETEAMEIDLANDRQRLIEMFCGEPLSSLPSAEQLKRIVTSSLPTSDIADLIAFHMIDSIPIKQSLLAEPDVRSRVSRLVSMMEAQIPAIAFAVGQSCDADMN